MGEPSGASSSWMQSLYSSGGIKQVSNLKCSVCCTCKLLNLCDLSALHISAIGITACTYLPKLQKMLCTIETTGIASGVNTQFDFDTYILEASAPDGHFPAGSKFKLVTYMRSFGPEAYFVHVPSRFAPDLTGGSDNGIGYMAMAANFAEGIVPSEGGCGCSHCTVYNECQMGGIMHPTGGIYGMNLQKIRLCGPALNISCKTPPRLTLDKERKWVPPKLRDFERSAVASGHFPGAVDVASHPSTAQTGRGRETPIYMGVDVDSNTPRVAPPANFSSCMSNSKSCSPALLEGEFVTSTDGIFSPLCQGILSAIR
eukprot:SAG31_NODE_436_length_15717_cov_5.420412_2_plen_314_part_00